MIAPHAVFELRLTLTFDSSFISIKNKRFNAAARRCSQWFYGHDILGKILLHSTTVSLERELSDNEKFNTNVVLIVRILGANCRLLFDTLMSEGFISVHIRVIRSIDLDSVAMRVKTRHWQSHTLE